MPFTAKDLVSAVSDVVMLPETVSRVIQMVDNPRYSSADIGEVICNDPGLTARLLRIANSPFYGFPSHIDSVPRAVAIIGTDGLRDLMLATSAVKLFSDLTNELVSMETFWRHSLRCAIIARALATKLRIANPESYFTAGLLHDIGYLIIYRELPELASKTLRHITQNREIVYIVEQEIIGFDHASVGGELLRLWNLPTTLIEAVEYHHTPSLAKQHPKEAAIVHIANYLANTMLARVGGGVEETEALDVTAMQSVGLTPDILQDILKQTEDQFNDTLDIIVYDEVA